MFSRFVALALLTPAAALAGPQVTATPATLDAVIAAASGGTTISASGNYDVVTIEARKFSPPLVIRGGSFSAIVLNKVDGVTLSGTTITGSPDPKSNGITIARSSNVRVEKAHIGGTHRAVVISNSTDFAVVNSRFDGNRSDGIDIAQSYRGVIADNVMLNFSPTRGTYAMGKLVKDADHPDGVQMWSRPSAPPTSDITLTGNTISGPVQCIFGGNHVRDGVDDGGFDRIVVEHNVCRNSFPRGVTLTNARASRVRFNDVASIPGSRLLKNGNIIKSQVSILPVDPSSVACGNIVADLPRSPATERCR